MLDGIRAFAVAWVVAHHALNRMADLGKAFLPPGEAFIRPVGYDDFNAAWFLAPVRMGQLSVDLFFLLSGFLMSYLLGRELRRSGRINYTRFLCRRWLRLTPAYVVAIAAYSAYTWRSCLAWGWTNLLFVNNLVGPQMYDNSERGLNSPDVGCMGHSWSIALEFQMYLVSPAVVWAMHASGRRCFAAIPVLGTAACVAARFAIWSAVPGYDSLESAAYNKPYARFAPYLAGMLVAHVLGPAVDAARERAAGKPAPRPPVACDTAAPLCYWFGVAGWATACFAAAAGLAGWAVDPRLIGVSNAGKALPVGLAFALLRPLFGVSTGCALFGMLVARLDADEAEEGAREAGRRLAAGGGAACHGAVAPAATAGGGSAAAVEQRRPALLGGGSPRADVPEPSDVTPLALQLSRRSDASTDSSAPMAPGMGPGDEDEEAAALTDHAPPRGGAPPRPFRLDPLACCPATPVGRWPASGRGLGSCLEAVWLVPLARLGYTVYLLHLPFIFAPGLFMRVMPLDGLPELWGKWMFVSAFALAVTLLVAAAVYTFVERPCNMLRERLPCTRSPPRPAPEPPAVMEGGAGPGVPAAVAV